MRSWLLAGVVALGSAMSLMPFDADARRFGGGGGSGMQRSMPSKPAPAAPQQAAAGTAAAGGAAAAAGKRSWMGPIAGLAAGLGIAALMSHLGMGEAFGNFLMLALLVVGGIFLVRMLMRRMAPASPLGAGAGAGNARAASGSTQRFEGLAIPPTGAAALGGGAAAAASSAWDRPATLPADFDREAFERIAKMIFIRMQTANDAGDLNDLRNFTTPEMFAVCKLELQDRDNKPQTTDVVRVDAEVLDLEKQGERQVVSVRFHGLISEDVGAEAAPFDEIWHLVRWGDNPSWAIAGIQQKQ
ncbi:MAG: Tim44-like domain-containing protein [Rubrivivax sp.]